MRLPPVIIPLEHQQMTTLKKPIAFQYFPTGTLLKILKINLVDVKLIISSG